MIPSGCSSIQQDTIIKIMSNTKRYHAFSPKKTQKIEILTIENVKEHRKKID